MDLSPNAATLVFVLCGLLVVPGTLLIWSPLVGDRTVPQRLAKIRRSRE